MIEDMYKRMTPEQYKMGINNAIEKTKQELSKQYQVKYQKLEEDYQRILNYNTTSVIDTISVELLYEIAEQMNYWEMPNETEEDKYIKESARYRIQEIYTNTMESIKKYANMKREGQARRTFEKKKKKVEKEFDIKF